MAATFTVGSERGSLPGQVNHVAPVEFHSLSETVLLRWGEPRTGGADATKPSSATKVR